MGREFDKLPVIQHVPGRPGEHRVVGARSESAVLTAAAAGRRMVSPDEGAAAQLQLLPVHFLPFVPSRNGRERASVECPAISHRHAENETGQFPSSSARASERERTGGIKTSDGEQCRVLFAGPFYCPRR